jgi:CheY-like chemotaxis protein
MPREYNFDGALLMVVDDDSLVQEVLQAKLERAGYRVCVLPDGDSALQAIAENLPDLLILDINMPGLDGFEVCRRLRSDERTRAMPILMLTAYGGLDHIVKGLEIGADDYMTKPFEFEELLVRIKSLLRMRWIERELREKETHLARIETMGQLLVTIAHYVNNSLAVISGRAQAVKKGDAESVAKLKKACLRETRRIEAVIKSLEAMAKQMKVSTTSYAGVENAMLDIEGDIEKRLEAVEN